MSMTRPVLCRKWIIRAIKAENVTVTEVLALRAILCKNQTKLEMKNFEPLLKFTWKKVPIRDVQKCQSLRSELNCCRENNKCFVTA